MRKQFDRNLASVMMTLMTSFSELAKAWRELDPDDHDSEELADRIRGTLMGMHSLREPVATLS